MSIKADNGNKLNKKAAKQKLWKFLKYKSRKGRVALEY
jgi:hypothetical protein